MKDDLLSEIKGIVKGRVAVNEMMSLHTTLRIGGPAEVLVEPFDLHDLRQLAAWARSRGIDNRVIGAGSNILVSDGGIKGVTIKLSSPHFRRIGMTGNDLLCGAGAEVVDLLEYGTANGLGGLEFLACIPGTIGGAVAMNAGAWGRDIADVIRDATVVCEDGTLSTVERDELTFGYRRCSLPRGRFIVSATFGVRRRSAEQVRREIERYAAQRRRRFPAGLSAGSIFKNPEGDYAGRLIEAAGLKGKTCGRAQISTAHANFILNLGGARAGDVLRLIEMAREAVRGMFGIDLETEIEIFGGVEA